MSRIEARRTTSALAAPLAAAALLAGLAGAATASPDDKLDRVQGEIGELEDRQGVLTSEIDARAEQLDGLRAQVATLRNQEAEVVARLTEQRAILAEARHQLEVSQDHLSRVRARLDVALTELERLLVEVYKSQDPDVIGVVMQAEGFEDMATRADYLQRLSDERQTIVDRVTNLRAEVAAIVERRAAAEQREAEATEAIASERQALIATRRELEAEEARFARAQQRSREVLAEVSSEKGHLEKIEARVQARIQAKLAGASSSQVIGPMIQGQETGGMTWPVEGTMTSPFGMRWGRMHEGIDISVPEGTPLKAAESGTVAMAGPAGGYGNYTCIDHGGGLSTCYAHQSQIAVSTGQSVTEGQLIGYSGNTGSSTGPHLHFEVRVDGAAQDPLGYL